MVRVVAFTGKRGSGKTTAANLYITLLMSASQPIQVERVSFAGPLKRLISVSGTGAVAKDSPSVMRPDWTEGRLMQVIGQGVRDLVGADAWANIAAARVRDAGERGVDVVVIDDLRYDNEYEAMCRTVGADNVSVYETTYDRAAEVRRADGRDPNHPSEAGLSTSVPVKSWDVFLTERF